MTVVAVQLQVSQLRSRGVVPLPRGAVVGRAGLRRSRQRGKHSRPPLQPLRARRRPHPLLPRPRGPTRLAAPELAAARVVAVAEAGEAALRAAVQTAVLGPLASLRVTPKPQP